MTFDFSVTTPRYPAIRVILSVVKQLDLIVQNLIPILLASDKEGCQKI